MEKGNAFSLVPWDTERHSHPDSSWKYFFFLSFFFLRRDLKKNLYVRCRKVEHDVNGMRVQQQLLPFHFLLSGSLSDTRWTKCMFGQQAHTTSADCKVSHFNMGGLLAVIKKIQIMDSSGKQYIVSIVYKNEENYYP